MIHVRRQWLPFTAIPSPYDGPNAQVGTTASSDSGNERTVIRGGHAKLAISAVDGDDGDDVMMVMMIPVPAFQRSLCLMTTSSMMQRILHRKM